MMNRLRPCIILLLLFQIPWVLADTFVFINSDDASQRQQINSINNLLYNNEFLIKDDLIVIDIAEEKRHFHGEFRLIQDTNGRYLSRYLPTAIPEALYVKNGHVVRREALDTFIAQHAVNIRQAGSKK